MFNLKRKQEGKGTIKKRKIVFGGEDEVDQDTQMKRLVGNQAEVEDSGEVFEFSGMSKKQDQLVSEKGREEKGAGGVGGVDDGVRGSKYMKNLLAAKEKRDEDRAVVLQKEVEKRIKSSGVDMIFETDAYKKITRSIGTSDSQRQGEKRDMKEKMENMGGEEMQQEMAAKYNINYQQLKDFIKPKLKPDDIDTYKLRYFERVTGWPT